MFRVSPPVFLVLLSALLAVAVVRAYSEENLVRKRREWILPPRPLKENVDYTALEFIAKIRSDFENVTSRIEYDLAGVGVDKPPYNVFVVDHKTGFIKVTKKLDREEISIYNLSGIARFPNGKEAEKRIDIRIKVIDENDNDPVFETNKPGEVYELSEIGTSVMKINATDADEPGNPNSQIAYTIINQSPDHDMFYISKDGTVHINKNSLDRELEDQYTLTVMGADLNGEPGGRTGTGTVVINVLDVNDNAPTLEKEMYEGSIEENTETVEVMRIKALDKDLEGTDNYEAVFDIVRGNEAGYFSITTDPKTNEGILMLDKAVDYEDVKNLELGLAVRNKAELYDGSSASGAGIGIGLGAGAGGGGGGATGASASSSGTSTWHSGSKVKTYPIKINVKNQPEGPGFIPKVKAIPISEGSDTKINEVIAHYPATDGDTGKPAENVRYAKGSDPDNWLYIDPKTAEIKLNKVPDRESEFLVNGTYFAKVLCMTEDMPAKTATGTIAIQVEDFNDNCPILTSKSLAKCTTSDSVIVSAEDQDMFPNGAPLTFSIVPEGTKGKWQVERLSDTSAILRAQEDMWPGLYTVELLVTDGQGKACPEPQKVEIQVCTCDDGAMCRGGGPGGATGEGAQFGPAAIGLLFLGLLLLALVPLLLLFCQCGALGAPGGFLPMPYDPKPQLINYHTEGQGENTEVPLMAIPTQVDAGAIGMANADASMAGFDYMPSVGSMNGMKYQGYQRYGEEAWGMNRNGFYEYTGDSGVGGGVSAGIFDGMALPDHFLEQYYSQKANSGIENQGVKDGLLLYDYEGQGSPVGSVGCCSLLESDNDLQFLDDLNLKFKTLAEVCTGKKISTEVKKDFTPPPMPLINTQTSVSSVVSTQQMPPPPQTSHTVVRETSERSQVVKENTATVRQGMTTVMDGVASQGQMLLLNQQQPVYYTTSVLQPVNYVVQPQVQNTAVLLAEAPATNLQGMVLVNGTQTSSAQGMIVQGQPVMSSGQTQVLVENSAVQGSGANLIHTGNLSGSQTVMVVDGKVPAGSIKVLKGSQTSFVQGGTFQSGGLSGSQRVLVVGGPLSSGGQLVQEAGGLSRKTDLSGSQRVLYSKENTSSVSQSGAQGSSTTTVHTVPTYSKVVVQETREIR